MSQISNVTRANKLNGTSHLSASKSNTHTQVAASGRCRFAGLRHNEIPKTIGRPYCLSNYPEKFSCSLYAPQYAQDTGRAGLYDAAAAGGLRCQEPSIGLGMRDIPLFDFISRRPPEKYPGE